MKRIHRLVSVIKFVFRICPFVTQEWSDVCCRGIRSAHVYILVYDICCFDSFEYIKTIRQQILETRYMLYKTYHLYYFDTDVPVTANFSPQITTNMKLFLNVKMYFALVIV